MPEKYITTPSTKRITGNIYASYIPSRPSVMPSPDFSTAELTKQVATLRAELRDGRLLQAKQRSQLSHESARIVALTRKYKEAKHERQELKVKLNSERGTVAAVEKRLSVAVKNHAEAQDKCARTMVECEKLRMLNEELVLSNEGLGVSKNEVKAGFDHKIKEIQRTFRIKLEEAEAAFVDRLEQNEQKLLMERLEETEELQKELDSRDVKIKKLEGDLNRQCEINAMFTIDYDRDTNFTKRLYVPLSVPGAVTSGHSAGPILPTQSPYPSPRRPLTNIESNQDTKSKKRPQATNEYDEKAVCTPLKLRRSSPLGRISRSNSPVSRSQESIQKHSGSSYSYGLTNRFHQLPTPDSSFRMSKRF